MPNREEALRKIFEATAVRLSDDQKRELLAHLDDAVEAKVDAGVPELEAVGQAFAELGSLKKLRFPEAAPAAATTSGALVEPWIGGSAAIGYLLLLLFSFVQIFITPALVKVFVEVSVPLPRLTMIFVGMSDWMRALWPLVALALAALVVVLARSRRASKGGRLLALSLTVGGAALLGGVLAGVTLPFVSLIEGIAR